MSVRRATKQFLQTTTLHGFKYLCSDYQTDRPAPRRLASSAGTASRSERCSNEQRVADYAAVQAAPSLPASVRVKVSDGDQVPPVGKSVGGVQGGARLRAQSGRGAAHIIGVCWVSWCVASACCAGVLCAVLWARFLQIPALLALQPVSSTSLPLPAVAVCLPALSAASLVVAQLSTEREVVRHLVVAFTRILEGKKAHKDHLILLEKLLVDNKLKVPDVLYESLPPCHEFMKRCRWQDTIVPCRELFSIQLTRFGVCCVMQPNKIKNSVRVKSDPNSNQRLSLLLQCSSVSFYGCQFFTRYESEGPPTPMKLIPGLEYLAQLAFKLIQDSDSEKLIDGTCVSTADYSQTKCMDKCMERLCRCSNPFKRLFDEKRNLPSPCRLSQMNCLRNYAICDCKPACTTLSTYLELQDSPITSDYVIDPFYAGINASSSTVLNLQVTVDGSRVFTRQPTETWFTLLSSLGGVFSMFLGVGLFSALELMFFLLVRVPMALKHAPEMDMPVKLDRP